MIARSVVALLGGVVLTVAACADDGNDRALQAERLAERAAEFRASQTTVPGGDDPAAASAVEPTGVVVPVVALDNTFRPQLIEVAVGDEVLWENRGLNEHNVLYVEGPDFGIEVDGFQPGDVYAHIFTEPGEYRYFCSIHGDEDFGMIGTVIVEG